MAAGLSAGFSKPMAKPVIKPATKREESTFSLATITGTASWLWGKTTEYAAPAATYAKSGAWFAFCAAALLAVPVLIEMQREAMLVVEKEHQTQQVEELQRQIASARSQASITSTIGALVGGAAGGDAAGAGAEAPAPSA